MNKLDFSYYRCLHRLITHSLLHLYFQLETSPRFVPVVKRNDILLRYLKPKLKHKNYALVKKDLRVMLQIARRPNGNLEQKLWALNGMSLKHKVVGAEKLYTLLVHLYDTQGLESRLFEEGDSTEPSVLYLLASHIDEAFQDGEQCASISMLIEWHDAPSLIEVIEASGLFHAELKEWNEVTKQAHILLHPA